MIDEPKNITDESTTDPAMADVRVPSIPTSANPLSPEDSPPYGAQAAGAEISSSDQESADATANESAEPATDTAVGQAKTGLDDSAVRTDAEVSAAKPAEREEFANRHAGGEDNDGEDKSGEDNEAASTGPAGVDESGEEQSSDMEAVDSSGAIEEVIDDPDEPIDMDWYILKVQSNRERSIAEALQRKVAIEGLDRYFGQVIVPTEKVTEFKGGKKKIVERKLWPGYIVVQMHINDDTWFAVRETSGIGDFTGAVGKPTPMQSHEVARVIQTEEEESEEAPKLAIKFDVGDKVKVKEGNFENFEGEVGAIDEASGKVTIMINIFGRSTPVELEYWQIEAV